MSNKSFTLDLELIRSNARQHLKKAAVTPSYPLNLPSIVKILNHVLSTEIICTLRYKSHYYKATKIGAHIAASAFLGHSHQEREHANKKADRIHQLQGDPEYSPEYINTNSYSEYRDCDTLESMLKENIVAERIAIDIYRELIHYIDNKDPVTRNMMEDILKDEKEHADDLLDLCSEYHCELA